MRPSIIAVIVMFVGGFLNQPFISVLALGFLLGLALRKHEPGEE